MFKKSISFSGKAISSVVCLALILLAGGFGVPGYLFNAGSDFGYKQSTKNRDTICATMEVYERMIKKDRNYERNLLELENFTKSYIKNHKRERQAIVKIPVVVHIVWNTAAQNISNAVVQSQIDVLNEDYRRLNADTVDTPDCFKRFGADSKIEFVLAKRDPLGNPTNGITRTHTTVTTFTPLDEMKFDSLGGHNIWDRDKYLNIWVCNLSGATAYSQFPGGNPATDGNVIRYTYFGTVGPAVPNNAEGRVTTHELGHWFNLWHIWGDAYCGDDHVEDTPRQEAYNLSCQTFPHITCNNGPTGDMYMNYMDYSLDYCANIFTIGQSDRMSACLNGIRLSLLTSNGGEPVSGIPAAHFRSDKMKIIFGESVHFYDESGGIPANWQWTFEGGNPSSSSEQNPVVTYSTPGLYTVRLRVSNSYGTDSVSYVNYLNVQGINMTAFIVLYPPLYTVIETDIAGKCSKFTWNKSGTHPAIKYKWKVKKENDVNELSYDSDDNGSDTLITVRNSFMDTIGAILGGNNSYVPCIWSAMAYNGTDSLQSINILLFTIVRKVHSGIKEISQGTPDKYGLYQNYPNPFNSETTIRFAVPKKEFVRIVIYDFTGRELEIPVNGILRAGYYECNYDAGALSSGVYFYKMQAGNFSEVRKMILIK